MSNKNITKERMERKVTGRVSNKSVTKEAWKARQPFPQLCFLEIVPLSSA